MKPSIEQAQSHRCWRLVCDGDWSGALNMGRDQAVLETVVAGLGRPMLRLYGWSPPCLSLGRHQGLDAADLKLCAERGVHVVRRPTGGRAVLHHLELTYSVVAPLASGPIPRALQDAYRTVCRPLVVACRALGIGADLTGGEVNTALPGPRTTVPCFKAPAGGEVVVGGRKLIGSAMRSTRGAILQHGAILLDWDGELQARTMGLPDDHLLRPFITTFAEQLGRVPSREALEAAFARAFSECLEVDLEPEGLSPEEVRRSQVIADEAAILPAPHAIGAMT
jgi:lipoate-protein ligase A